MIFLPTPAQPNWADAWDRLHQWPDLHVLYLTRRDRLAQYASLLLAGQTGVYHPYDNDPLLRPEHRPCVTIDPQEFRQWVAQRDALFAQRRRRLAGLPAFEMDYETLTGAWDATMLHMQQFLGVAPRALEQGKRKQETRPLSETIANYAELESTLETSAAGR
jgi:LPS sulfotransferase NodH